MRMHLFKLLALIPVALAMTGDRITSPGCDGYYFGTLSDGRVIAFDISSGRTNVTFILHLSGSPYFHSLEGPLQIDGAVSVSHEADWERDVSQSLRGTVSGNPPEFSGSLITTNTPQGIKVIAKKVGTRETLDCFKGIKISKYGGGKAYREEWPSFPGTNELLNAVSTMLQHDVESGATDFLTGGYQMGWDALKERSTSGIMSWESLGNTSISWCSPQLVSLYHEERSYTGGAHGNEGISTHNFTLSGAEPKKIALEDIFLPFSGWRQTLCTLCTRELVRQQASDFAIPTRQIKIEDLSTFTLDNAGISFHFEPYRMGSYAEGSYHIFIPWTELHLFLNTQGPIRYLNIQPLKASP